MEQHKSQTDFYVRLLSKLLVRDGNLHPSVLSHKAYRSLVRDLLEVQNRSAKEGLGFLTQALPTLGKALELGLDTGQLEPTPGFKPAGKDRVYPAFLQTWWSRVFDGTGALLPHADVDAVRHLRTVCFFMYKTPFARSQESDDKLVAEWERVNAEYSAIDANGWTAEKTQLVRTASLVIRDLLQGFDPKDPEVVRPRMGPGALSTGEVGVGKWALERLLPGLNAVYPAHLWQMTQFEASEIYQRYPVETTDPVELLGAYSSGRLRPVLEPPPNKFIIVDKNSRTGRVIQSTCCEQQFFGQGLARALVNHLERNPLVRGHINFTSQLINRALALAGSIRGAFVTLDLQAASDSVSWRLVRELFALRPDVLEALLATSSPWTKMPDGRILQRSAAFGMGDAACFVVEAISFFSLIMAELTLSYKSLRTPGPLPPWAHFAKGVWIYGDDIICIRRYAKRTVHALAVADLRVNRGKSCFGNRFKESCGMVAFDGHDVSAVSLRAVWSGSSADGSAFESFASLANRLAGAGYYEASRFLLAEIEKVWGPIPFGYQDSPMPCVWVPAPSPSAYTTPRSTEYLSKAWDADLLNKHVKRLRSRWNAARSCFEVWASSTKLRKVRTAFKYEWQRLLSWFLQPSEGDPEVTDVPRSSYVIRGWARI